jgi:hypothetical protein
MAQDCAKDAANYVHPKLASVQHGGDPDNPLKLEGGGVTDIERLQVMAAVLVENPKLLDQLLKLLEHQAQQIRDTLRAKRLKELGKDPGCGASVHNAGYRKKLALAGAGRRSDMDDEIPPF